VIVYPVGRIDLRVARFFMKTRFITLVNTAGGKGTVSRNPDRPLRSGSIAGHVRAGSMMPRFTDLCQELTALRHQVAETGSVRPDSPVHPEELQRKKHPLRLRLSVRNIPSLRGKPQATHACGFAAQRWSIYRDTTESRPDFFPVLLVFLDEISWRWATCTCPGHPAAEDEVQGEVENPGR